MAEASGIVSAAPGMLPIVIKVIKGFGNLCRVVEIANSCTKQLEGIYAALRVLSELTLKMVSPGTQPPVLMTKDLENPLWTDDALEARIRTRFSGSYEQFTALVEALRGIQVLLQTELSIFDDILKEKQNRESRRSVFKRLRLRSQVELHLPSYEEKISQIRRYNYEITVLRDQVECSIKGLENLETSSRHLQTLSIE